MLHRYQSSYHVIEQAAKPHDYYEAILRMGELGVLPAAFVRQLAPISGFRNILIHEYLSIDWDEVFDRLQQIADLEHFADLVTAWLGRRLSL